jgi:hypothetical protein
VGTARKVTLGSLIDKLYAKQQEIKALKEQIKDLEKQEEDLEQQVLEKCEEQETTQARGSSASATVSDKVLPQITNWDAFYAYIHDNKFFQLLQRRPSVTACRELFDAGTDIPGVEKFTKRGINLRGL